MRRNTILRGLGEAIVQLGLIGILIFILERLNVYRIMLVSYNPEVLWWLAESGIAFVLLLIIPLIITNLIFIFIHWRWWVRGTVESGAAILLYFGIEILLQPIIQFTYSNLLFYLITLALPLLLSNLLFSRYFPNTPAEELAAAALQTVKRDLRSLKQKE